MYNKENIDLSVYRLEKAKNDLDAAEKNLELALYSTAANRSYYSIFHAARAVLALNGTDFKRHSGVIANFRKEYVKTGIFNKRMSDILTEAFDLRTESDYEDFYVLSKEDVKNQVESAKYFYENVEAYLRPEWNKQV